MTAPGMRLDPVTRYVRGLPGDYLLAREAADVLGISVERLKRLGRRLPETLGPGAVTFMGEVKIFLYDQADLEQLRAYFAHRAATRPKGLPDPNRAGRGRPPMWTAAEHAARHRRRALARYHRITAEQFEAQGRPDRAERSRARAADIKQRLDEQLARRKARLSTTPAAA